MKKKGSKKAIQEVDEDEVKELEKAAKKLHKKHGKKDLVDAAEEELDDDEKELVKEHLEGKLIEKKRR